MCGLQIRHGLLEFFVDVVPVYRIGRIRVPRFVFQFIGEMIEIHVVEKRRFSAMLNALRAEGVVQDTQQPRPRAVFTQLKTIEPTKSASEGFLRKILSLNLIARQHARHAIDYVQMGEGVLLESRPLGRTRCVVSRRHIHWRFIYLRPSPRPKLYLTGTVP